MSYKYWDVEFESSEEAVFTFIDDDSDNAILATVTFESCEDHYWEYSNGRDIEVPFMTLDGFKFTKFVLVDADEKVLKESDDLEALLDYDAIEAIEKELNEYIAKEEPYDPY